jgi:hypothetical protein
VVLGVGLPLVIALVRDRAADQRQPLPASDVAVSRALRSWICWILILVVAGSTGAFDAILLADASTVRAAALAVMLIGFGMGGEVDTLPFLLSRYFGLRSLSTLYFWCGQRWVPVQPSAQSYEVPYHRRGLS